MDHLYRASHIRSLSGGHSAPLAPVDSWAPLSEWYLPRLKHRVITLARPTRSFGTSFRTDLLEGEGMSDDCDILAPTWGSAMSQKLGTGP